MHVRAITPDELPAWRLAMLQTFGADPDGDPPGEARLRALVDPARTFAAFEGGNIVGTAAAFDFALSLPGGQIPMSGLTMVTVRPTHRRQGILRALIAAHVEGARAHGDPLSGLWASEATIYGRFGYGIACESDYVQVDGARDTVAVGFASDAIEIVDYTAALVAAPPIYDALFAARAGVCSRSPAWWQWRRMLDRPDQRNGGTARTYALARRDGVVTGYLAFRQRLSKSNAAFTGDFTIDELVAVDARAEASLWRLATNADLFPHVSYGLAPVDSLVPWLVADRRRVVRHRADTLWLRVDDVARVLSARRYASDERLVLDVAGERYALVVDHGAAVCQPVDEGVDLTIERATLGSLLLGAFSASELARAGLVQGTDDALARADRMFRTATPPWCPEVF